MFWKRLDGEHWNSHTLQYFCLIWAQQIFYNYLFISVINFFFFHYLNDSHSSRDYEEKFSP